jgi:general secretion pathway protein K
MNSVRGMGVDRISPASQVQGARRAAAKAQRGAALLGAMLLVSLVAALAATALWQQWRLTEVERNERGRQQALWLVQGALDWARLILREDARGGGADHLGEPWAVPLQEARLSSFLASDGNASGLGGLNEVFLSGQIEDLQGRLNLSNLIEGDTVSLPDVQMAERLFELLDLPPARVQQLARALLAAKAAAAQSSRAADVGAASAATGSWGGFLPTRVDELVWLGLPADLLTRLAPHISVLPERTVLNLNTASAELISASLKGLDLGQARRLVQARQRQHWRDLVSANTALGPPLAFDAQRHGVQSRYFLITGHLRRDDLQVSQQALVRRDGLDVRVLWRQSGGRALEPQPTGLRP